MKKTQKMMLGFLGLSVVAATTIFAATLPNPEAAAVSTVTDNLSVRVVGATAKLNINSPINGEEYTNRYQTLSFDYENVETVTVTLKYTDASGVVHTYILDTIDADYTAGSGTIDLNLADPGFGYGDYEIIVSGDSVEGILAEDQISFSYYPVVPSITDNQDNGEITMGFDYDKDNENIEKVVVNVYDENSNPVPGLSPLPVTDLDGKLELDFDGLKVPPGTYTITVTTYSADGNIIYKAYTILFEYKGINIPNTGGLFNNLNISQSDYLVTGLISFFIVGFAGLFYVAKSKKQTKRR